MNEKIDVTECLNRMRSGDPEASRRLAALVYADLKTRAENLVKRVPTHEVGATTLVHEAYLRITDGVLVQAGGREHFMAIASKIMRDLLVDMARRRAAKKRRGDGARITLALEGPEMQSRGADVLAVHEALLDLAQVDPRLAQIVEMRYFGGMVGDEIADHLGISRRTVVRELGMAQSWLRKALGAGPKSDDEE